MSYIDDTLSGWLVKDDRVYVDDPAEVPQGAKLETGPRNGMYYKPSSVESFHDYVENHRAKVFEETDITPEDPVVQRADELTDDYEAVAQQTYTRILEAMQTHGVDIQGASHRVKDSVSMAEKIHRKEKYDSITELQDIFGARVYASPETIQNAVDAIQEEFGDDVLREKDSITDPKDGYYRAYHANFEFDDGKVGEIQLKTPEAGEIADVGWKMVYKASYDFGDDVSEDEAEVIREEIADCLTASMDMVMNEDPSTPGCTDRATEYIRDHMGYT